MRLRITFSKTGALRYTGHLDLHKIWERTVRRAGLPLAYTQGFHPGPKIQLASALPLGFIGDAEVVDVWLDDGGEPGGEANPASCREMLQAAAPPGLEIREISGVDSHQPPLQTQLVAAEYTATLLEPADEAKLAEKISDLLDAASLPRERRGKSYDLRPLVEALSLTPSLLPMGEEKEVRVFMRLAAREGATGRPEEVLEALGIPPDSARIERTRLIFKSDLRSTA